MRPWGGDGLKKAIKRWSLVVAVAVGAIGVMVSTGLRLLDDGPPLSPSPVPAVVATVGLAEPPGSATGELDAVLTDDLNVEGASSAPGCTGVFLAGDVVTVHGWGFAPGSDASLVFVPPGSSDFADTITLGELTVGGDGLVVGSGVLPGSVSGLAGLYVIGTANTTAPKSQFALIAISDQPVSCEEPSPPVIQISVPADGAVYKWGEIVVPVFECLPGADGVPIQSCGGSVDPGETLDTYTVGANPFSVMSMDQAGVATLETVEYFVEDPFKIPASG